MTTLIPARQRGGRDTNNNPGMIQNHPQSFSPGGAQGGQLDTDNRVVDKESHTVNQPRWAQEEIRDQEVSGEQQWETTSGWLYTGHGNWMPPEELAADQDPQEGKVTIEWESQWIHKWRCSVDKDIALHEAVWDNEYPNRWGAKIPVESRWNTDRFEEMLQGYEDMEVVEWLKYGWPSGRLPTGKELVTSCKNHKGATDYPEALHSYISKEQRHSVVMGPYDKIPFRSKVGISPLSTRPKKNTQDRRVILDLSFPPGESVNDGMLKDNYLGFQAKLTFPGVDDYAFRIFSLGQGCMMFKIDLSRYFRQLPLDPGDYSLIGYIIDGKLYFDKVLPMGMRTAPYIAQRVTNAIAFIHRRMTFFLLNYVDDFVGAENRDKIWASYRALSSLLEELRVDTSQDKIVPPTTRLEFLGIIFDSTTMTMKISEEKMEEIRAELDTWLYKTRSNRKEVESLIGKLQFISKCIKAGRVFISRLIHWLRGMDRKSKYSIPLEARKDIAWWARCATHYNGISLIWLHKDPKVDGTIATGACLTGYGGTIGNKYFRARFPKELCGQNIAYLEILAVMVALKLWGQQFTGKYFWIHVDNEAVATVLNTGASRNSKLQDVLREIALLAARHQFVIKAQHIMGVLNRVPDWLSRWGEPQAKKQFRQHAQDRGLTRVRVQPQLLQLTNEW